MKRTELTRRNFLSKILMTVYGVAFLGSGGVSIASAAAKKKPRPTMRPPRTCGGWTDKDLNGSCDHSESGRKPCTSRKCPGHKDNSRRKSAKRNGAPEGTCALWKDLNKKGYCTLSIHKRKPCTYKLCVAHKDNVDKDKKQDVVL